MDQRKWRLLPRKNRFVLHARMRWQLLPQFQIIRNQPRFSSSFQCPSIRVAFHEFLNDESKSKIIWSQCNQCWYIPIVASGPRSEITYGKHPWQKSTLKSAQFRSFGLFLESTLYLHWPNVWNPILSTSVKVLSRISSKTPAHRAARNIEEYSLASWQCTRSQFETFFRKDWIRKTQRVPHPHYSPDLGPSDFFLFGYLKEKHNGTSFTPNDDLIVAIRQILETVLKIVFTYWITEMSSMAKKVMNTPSKNPKELNSLYRIKKSTWVTNSPTAICPRWCQIDFSPVPGQFQF
jgi:hypothetical protein